MWRRSAKLDFPSFSVFREFGTLFCSHRRFYSDHMRPLVHLHNSSKNAELFLIGSNHVSLKSAEFVRDVIKDVRPDVIAVELCKHRGEEVLSSEDHKSIPWKEFLQMKGGLTDKILTYLINELYAHLATKGLKPGEEMRVALEEGMDLNAAILFMDQDMDVIMKRAAEGFSLMDLIRVVWKRKQVLRQCPALVRVVRSKDYGEDFNGLVEGLMHPEARAEAIWVGETYFPGLYKSLVHDRNEHMVNQLRNLSGKIVGVVGALHLQGMQRLWQDAEDEPHQTRVPLSHMV